MRINYIMQPLSAEIRKTEAGAKKAEKDIKAPKAAIADKSEFSAGAQRLSETKAEFQTIASSLSAQPDIRAEKIAEVKRKIERGFYDSPEFIDKLADKLLAEFGVKNPDLR